MRLALKIAAVILGGVSINHTAFAEPYHESDQEQLTLECVLANNKLASAFIAQDAAGYALGKTDAPTSALNLVTNQHDVTAYYNVGMISGGSLY
ncbi:hypothetical protein [Kluyvera ascorbata]|uniref:hypothetical protein n=1 Tax=Kluyvera ascorbata TaxID=51288 RepID=UPI0034D5AB51